METKGKRKIFFTIGDYMTKTEMKVGKGGFTKASRKTKATLIV